MVLYPAIDLAGGKCVRLLQGVRDAQTVYGEHPEEIARKWHAEGAEFLHVVDLDGAFEGASLNRAAIEKIVSSVPVPVQVGGGIRDLSGAEALFGCGVKRIILGTIAVERPEVAEEFLYRFGKEKVVVGIDVKNGRVALRGWTREAAVDPARLALDFKSRGVSTFVFTDISRDGMLSGPNYKALEAFGRALGGGVIASGGAASLDDVIKMNSLGGSGIDGLIIGKALYENRFTLSQALAAVNQKAEYPEK